MDTMASVYIRVYVRVLQVLAKAAEDAVTKEYIALEAAIRNPDARDKTSYTQPWKK